MDIKEYIASGIVESYVLGTASDQEQQEVRCMSSIYPEIDVAVRAYEKRLNQLADANAIQPPKELKDKVLTSLYTEIDSDLTKNKETKVVSISKNTELSSRKNSWKITAVASFVLFIIATSVFINSQSSKNTLQTKLEQKEGDFELALSKANKKAASLNDSLTTFENQLAFLSNKETKEVQLKGTEKSKSAAVSVYWNTDNNRILLKVNELPPAPSKKQYQLWAIIDEKPTDMGLLPLEGFGNALIEMPNQAKNPVAFAITLEQEGGKPEPNLEALYVIGNV